MARESHRITFASSDPKRQDIHGRRSDQNIFIYHMNTPPRLDEALDAPCPCGQTDLTKRECWDLNDVHPRAVTLRPIASPKNSPNPRCYLRSLGGSGGGLSGEHVVSECVLNEMFPDGSFKESGGFKQARGEIRQRRTKKAVARVLCARHNNWLSPLDASATGLTSALIRLRGFQRSDEDRQDRTRAVFNGRDLERWLLKFAFGHIASGADRVDDVQRLGWSPTRGQAQWLIHGMPRRPFTGLYIRANPADNIGKYEEVAGDGSNTVEFGIRPLWEEPLQLLGIEFRLCGLEIILWFDPFDRPPRPDLGHLIWHPSCIYSVQGPEDHAVFITWPQGQRGDAVEFGAFDVETTDMRRLCQNRRWGHFGAEGVSPDSP